MALGTISRLICSRIALSDGGSVVMLPRLSMKSGRTSNFITRCCNAKASDAWKIDYQPYNQSMTVMLKDILCPHQGHKRPQFFATVASAVLGSMPHSTTILKSAAMSASDFLQTAKFWLYRINEFLVVVVMDDVAQVAWIFT